MFGTTPGSAPSPGSMLQGCSWQWPEDAALGASLGLLNAQHAPSPFTCLSSPSIHFHSNLVLAQAYGCQPKQIKAQCEGLRVWCWESPAALGVPGHPAAQGPPGLPPPLLKDCVLPGTEPGSTACCNPILGLQPIISLKYTTFIIGQMSFSVHGSVFATVPYS